MRTVLPLIIFLFSASAMAEPQDRADAQKILSPFFFVEGSKPGIEAFPLKSTSVIANISGVIAEVAVTQVYENRGVDPIHARYVFPGSTRAAVHGMRIRVRDKAVVAKIRERQQAVQEFAQAKAEGKNAALLEQQRPNVFTMAVSNIMPGDRVEVQLVYSEIIAPEEGIYRFVYPTVVGPRYSHTPEASAPEDKWVKSPYLHAGQPTPSSFSIRVNISSGVPLGELRSPSHQPMIDWEGLTVARVSLDNDAGARDFVLEYRLSGRQIQSGLFVFENEMGNYFLLTVQPPERIAQGDIPPREYIFVLDVSGSMYGFPIDTAKQLIESLIRNLRPTDTFNVVLFAGGSRVLSPVSLAANSQNIARAASLISSERGGGGTELAAALRSAIGLPRIGFVSRTVVVITDGYIAEEEETFELIGRSLNDTNFFAFGIGGGVNRYLIEGIARSGQGEPFVVLGPQEAPVAAARFRSYIEAPVLTKVQVTYRGFDAFDVEPGAQPDVFAERPVVVFGKWKGARQGEIEVAGRTATGMFTRVFEVADSVSRVEHSALPQLWARSRIARLSDFSVRTSDPEAVREVTTLGLTYSLLTRYTSFIAVLEEVRNPTSNATDVDQPLPMPDGVSDLAIGYGSGAEPDLWLMLLAAALVVIGLRAGVRPC